MFLFEMSVYVGTTALLSYMHLGLGHGVQPEAILFSFGAYPLSSKVLSYRLFSVQLTITANVCTCFFFLTRLQQCLWAMQLLLRNY